jgi:putative ABC transport system permease protein
MNPLSASNFFRHNKRKFISSMIIIVVAICIVYIMECFIRSILASNREVNDTCFKNGMIVLSTKLVPEIPQTTVKSIENNAAIEKAVPVTVQYINFTFPVSPTHAFVLGTTNGAGQEYLIKKFNIKLRSGRLPELGKNEIAVDSSIAINNRLRIGSHVGSDLDKSQALIGNYVVVGILENDSRISLMGSPTPEQYSSSTLKRGWAGLSVFANKGYFAQAENAITSLMSHGLNAQTLSRYNKEVAANYQTFDILDMMVVLIILVMVVCLVCSKYAQYFARKSELGVLGALGYTRREIMRRTFWEVAISNLVSFIVGLVLAILLSRFIMNAAFEDVGAVGVYFYGKAILMSLIAPLSTTLFTLIPVYSMIGRIDPITIIEKN